MAITKTSFGGGEHRAMPMPDDDADDQTRAAKKVTIKTGKGNPNITFKPGGLHESLGVPSGEPIPPEKMAAALAGEHGPKAQKQANFAKSLAKMRPGKRADAPDVTQKGPSTRTLGPAAGAVLVPTAVLGNSKKRGPKT